MKQLKDYVRTYDDAIDGKFAKELINIFERNKITFIYIFFK